MNDNRAIGTRRPIAVALSGPPCSGKSTLAALLAERLGVRHLAVDVVRTTILPGEENRPEHRRTAYRAMHLCAEHLLRAGQGVALDATYHPLAEREALERVIQETSAALYVVECRVSPEAAAARAHCRTTRQGSDLSEAEVWRYVLNFHSASVAFPVDTEQSPETNLARIIDHISTAPPLALGRWPQSTSMDETNQQPAVPLLEDFRPADAALYHQYVARSARGRQGFAIPDVPVYFLVPARPGRRFDVDISHLGHGLREEALERRFVRAGMDVPEFRRWRWHVATQRGRTHDDRLLRLCALHWQEHDRLEVLGAPCSFSDYLATEASANLASPGGSLALREMLEGARWMRRAVSLHDVAHTSRHFAAAVSVATLVTSTDGYIALQRRSHRVMHGGGHLSATATGFVSWDLDIQRSVDGPKCPGPASPVSLFNAVLRELQEEAGISPEDLDPQPLPFIGAAYNLLHGRDLNFYAAIQTHLDRTELEARIQSATDGWEHTDVIFVPQVSVAPDGTLTGPFAPLLPQCNRHLRAALHALAVATPRIQGR